MGDISRFYGKGKSGAHVIDLRPINRMIELDRASNEKKAAQKIARKATKAAALNSMSDKLKNEGWSRHNEYLQNKLNDVNKYVMEEIGSGGETVFADSPEKQVELKGKIQDFISWNQWSKNLTTEANKQLARAEKSRKDIDVESLGEFNHWHDQSPEYQRSNPMPRIKDRNRNLNDIMKDDYSSALGKMSKRTAVQGVPDPETGRIKKSDVTITDTESFEGFVKNISENPNNPANIESGEMAARQLEGEGIVGRTIIDENGEEVNNPEYFKRYNELKNEFIRESAEIYLPKESKLYTASFKPGAGKEEALSVTEVTEGERGYTTERGYESFKKNKKYSASAKDSTGKVYFKLKVPIYKYGGKTYTIETLPETSLGDEKEIKAGTWVDDKGNQIKDPKELLEIKERKKQPSLREVTIQNSRNRKIRVNEIILPDGSKEVKSEESILEGTLVGYQKVNAVEKDNEFIFEGDKGYDPKKSKEVEIVTVKTKRGTVQTRATDQVKEIFKKEFDKISEGESKDITEEEYSQLKSGDTYTYQGETYTKE